MKKELLIKKIDSLIASAKHECTMSGNIDAQRYLKKMKNWVAKQLVEPRASKYYDRTIDEYVARKSSEG